jgi:hypothetical protein
MIENDSLVQLRYIRQHFTGTAVQTTTFLRSHVSKGHIFKPQLVSTPNPACRLEGAGQGPVLIILLSWPDSIFVRKKRLNMRAAMASNLAAASSARSSFVKRLGVSGKVMPDQLDQDLRASIGNG